MQIYNVGQGNALFLKNKERMLIVDCGFFQTGSYCFNKRSNNFDGRYRPMIAFTENVEDITIVVTHSHFDHHSFLEYMPFDFYKKVRRVYGSFYGKGTPLRFPAYVKEVGNIGEIVSYKCGGNRFCSYNVNQLKDIEEIRNVLGNDVVISPILPASWPCKGNEKEERSKDPNDNSISLVVAYGKNKILFTGDATGATWDKVLDVPDNIEKLKDITCVMLPHHGSNLNGAFTWFYFAKCNVTKNFVRNLFVFISSDPKMGDYLPWDSVSKFECSKVPVHKISTRSCKHVSENGVYLSSDAEKGFWNIFFYKDGNLEVYDGDKVDFSPDVSRVSKEDSLPFFCIMYKNASPMNKKARVEALFKKMLEVKEYKIVEWIIRIIWKDNYMRREFVRLLRQEKEIPESVLVGCVNEWKVLFGEQQELINILMMQERLSANVFASCAKQDIFYRASFKNIASKFYFSNRDEWRNCSQISRYPELMNMCQCHFEEITFEEIT